MNVTNCRGCGRLFNVISNKRFCPNCVRQLEEKFQVVKKYIGDNPHSTMEVISKECEVTIKQIKEWVREERLTFAEGSVQGIDCEKCGTMILTGRFCESCKNKIQNNLRGAIDTPKREESKKRDRDRDRDRMRFLQNL